MWKCPFAFLGNKVQQAEAYPATDILQLNYDCYLEILSYLNTLEDQLNFARAHPKLCEIFMHHARFRYAKINVRMLESIVDWEYLLELCGSNIQECEVRCGNWDKDFVLPFMALLGKHCTNLWHMHLIFVQTYEMTSTQEPAENQDSIMEKLQELRGLRSLSLGYSNATQMKQLQDINNLESLYIHGIDVKLSSLDFVQAFSSMQQLRTLSLYFGSAYSRAQQVPDLATHCPLLEHLTLYMFNANLVDLGDFVNLKSLHLIARRNLAIETSLYRSLTTKYANRLQLLEIKNVKIEHHQANYIVRLKALRALLCDRWPIVAWPLLSQLTELECLQLKEHVAGGNESASTDVLLNVIADLTKLRHLKLGKQWPIDDTLVSAVREVLCRRTGAKSGEEHIPFVLTLSSDLAPELENKLSVLRLGYFLRVDLSGSTTCQHCKLDGPDDVYPKQVLGITCWD